MRVEPYTKRHLRALHVINQDSTPGVRCETVETLEKRINLSTAFVAIDELNTPLGFITLIELGTQAYDSENLRWFETYQAKTGSDLIYVDRIAVAQHARGLKIGAELYNAAFAAFSTRRQIGCEINIAPPNPGSMRFHKRLGFQRCGTRSYGDNKSVAYHVRKLGVPA